MKLECHCTSTRRGAAREQEHFEPTKKFQARFNSIQKRFNYYRFSVNLIVNAPVIRWENLFCSRFWISFWRQEPIDHIKFRSLSSCVNCDQ